MLNLIRRKPSWIPNLVVLYFLNARYIMRNETEILKIILDWHSLVTNVVVIYKEGWFKVLKYFRFPHTALVTSQRSHFKDWILIYILSLLTDEPPLNIYVLAQTRPKFHMKHLGHLTHPLLLHVLGTKRKLTYVLRKRTFPLNTQSCLHGSVPRDWVVPHLLKCGSLIL